MPLIRALEIKMEIEQLIISGTLIALIITILGVVLYRRKNEENSRAIKTTGNENILECPYCSNEVPYEIVWSQIRGFNLKAFFSCPNCKENLTLSKVHFISLKITMLLMLGLAINLVFQIIVSSEAIFSILVASGIIAFILIELISSVANKRIRVEKVE